MSGTSINVKKTQYQSLLLLGLACFFVAHFTLLNPSSLEQDFSDFRVVAPQDLLAFFQNEKETLAKNVPMNMAPAYAIRDLEYFATDNERKNWKMLARKSFMYQAEQITHARDATLIWDEGQVTAKEAVAYQLKNEVELYGDVLVTLKNGLTLKTNYVKLNTVPFTYIQVPMTERVQGQKDLSKNSHFEFSSQGLTYSAQTEHLVLLSQVDVQIETQDKTQVLADSATYIQKDETLNFTMMENQPLERQYVKAHQKSLDLRSRSMIAQLFKQKIQVLTANKEVHFNDFTNPKHPVSGISGKAVYKEEKQLLFLMDFPQVYQDNDTITGDMIIYDRTKDTIEVEQSNAFNKR